ncbi:hypothetical protein [Beijerinckia sp. L45]|uniref:hypothetical protein n=1 Tax=Beijerinckia sp. L45 TaxID=1641855 RepID=UPI00131E6A27|nr:hypothetical protein [Beijerinckia sp. L45]
MDDSIKSHMDRWEHLSTDELYALLPPETFGLDEDDAEGRVDSGRTIFIRILPRIREHICGTELYHKLLRERPMRTHVEIAVLLLDLLPGASIMGVPCGPVLLIIIREMFESFCVPGRSF